MRRPVTVDKIKRFMTALARSAKSGGNVYFTGGTTAMLLGIREQTIDVDIKFDPEPVGVFEAISGLKNELDLNIELASPDDFIPTPSDWKERSTFIEKIGDLLFYHYDLTSQALAKIERGLDQDISDVTEFLKRGFITESDLKNRFASIKSLLIRYPSIDSEEFERKVSNFIINYSLT